MSPFTDKHVYEAEAALLVAVLVGFGLAWLLRLVGRKRPGMALTRPLIAAFGVRIMAAAAISMTAIGDSIRGGDEASFMYFGRLISESPLGSERWTDGLTSNLHQVVFAAQLHAFDAPEFALRVTQAGISVAGLLLLATAVYDLAGRRAATVAAWIMALEPANVFFSTLLHKEALLLLAEGLVVFGGTLLWTRGRLTGVGPFLVGCLIAIATRRYAGFFLVASGVAIALHASLGFMNRAAVRSLALLAGVVAVVALAAPFAWQSTSAEALKNLEISQRANAADESNLKLEEVHYLSRADLVRNLPRRVRDLLVRPYPWQVGSVNQRLGLVGGLFALALLVFLAHALWVSRGRIMQRAGPLVYVGGLQLVVYALSVGNAGTGFRYRTHLVAIGICLAVVLRARHRLAVQPTPSRPLEVAPRPVAIAR